jgi:ribosome-associated protein
MSDISSDMLSHLAVKGMQEKKGLEVTLINLRSLSNSISDYLVICTGSSDTHVSSLADSVEEEIKKATGDFPLSREGKTNGNWVLLDYANIIVHVFQKSAREFYSLEKLWGDAKITKFDDAQQAS